VHLKELKLLFGLANEVDACSRATKHGSLSIIGYETPHVTNDRLLRPVDRNRLRGGGRRIHLVGRRAGQSRHGRPLDRLRKRQRPGGGVTRRRDCGRRIMHEEAGIWGMLGNI